MIYATTVLKNQHVHETLFEIDLNTRNVVRLKIHTYHNLLSEKLVNKNCMMTHIEKTLLVSFKYITHAQCEFDVFTVGYQDLLMWYLLRSISGQ